MLALCPSPSLSLSCNNKDKWPSGSQVWDRCKGEVIYLWSLTSVSPDVSSSNEHVRLMVQFSQRLKDCDLLEEHLAPPTNQERNLHIKKRPKLYGRNQANEGGVIHQHNAHSCPKWKPCLSHLSSTRIFGPLSFLLRGIIRRGSIFREGGCSGRPLYF